MKNWRKNLCIAMAMMMLVPSVSVSAEVQEEAESSSEVQESVQEETESNSEVQESAQEETESSSEVQEETEQIAETEKEEAVETEVTEEVLATEETETAEVEETENTLGANQPSNPVYNESTKATKWSYVYFGRYPQSQVTGQDLDDSIVNANYNINGDAVVDGVKYRRVQNGDTKYYRYEPIKWRVMENDGTSLWLIADQTLFETSRDYGSYVKYSVSCSRSILNGYNELENELHVDFSGKGANFYTMAFNMEEQDIMLPITVTNAGVTDMVIIPEYEDLTNKEKGFGSDYSRIATRTDYVPQKGTTESYSEWIYQENNRLKNVWSDGQFERQPFISRTDVCPEIHISLDSDLWSMQCPDNSFEAQNIADNSVSVTLSKTNYIYDGKEKTPTITVRDGSETLTEGVDYTVTYLNNMQAGTTAAVRLSGTGDYISNKDVYFTIGKAEQAISVNKNITKKTTDKKFKLGAQVTTGDGALSYASDNTSVAKVDKYGNVTICGGGVANITVTASETNNYKAATAVTTLTVTKIITSLSVKTTKITKTYGDKAFRIETEAPDDAEITYTSSDKSVATVNSSGKVTIKGCGTANIVVKMEADEQYESAKKTVKLTVKPKKNKISNISSKKKSQITLKWKKDSKASGYEVVYSYNGKNKKVDIKKNNVTSTTIKKLKRRKTYSVKIRSYKKVSGKKIYGEYSKVMKVKVK